MHSRKKLSPTPPNSGPIAEPVRPWQFPASPVHGQTGKRPLRFAGNSSAYFGIHDAVCRRNTAPVAENPRGTRRSSGAPYLKWYRLSRFGGAAARSQGSPFAIEIGVESKRGEGYYVLARSPYSSWKGNRMNRSFSRSRRHFLQASAIAGAGLALPRNLFASKKKSVLIFTKSSGFEHEVVKTVDGRPSILEQAVRSLAQQHGFEVTATKDGRVFDSPNFKKNAAVLFYTTLNLTETGTDGNPPMSPAGKQALLDAVHGGLGFVGVHAAADTFHTEPDPKDLSNRYIAHGENSDPYL